MTHKDIYTKFMIEYDKANVTSSYPSLTEYEVATVLDKAYNALIAQKVTGNNVRRTPFEADQKSISDLQPLVDKKEYAPDEITNNDTLMYDDIDNSMKMALPAKFLYYVGCDIKKQLSVSESTGTHTTKYVGPIDQEDHSVGPEGYRYRRIPVRLVSHQMAEKFKATASNIPWVKTPVCYMEGGKLCIVYDPYDRPLISFCELTYIKTPSKFVKDLSSYDSGTYFDGDPGNVKFELNDTVAEELISLAIAFALENVESQRLNTKLNMRGLEA